MRITGLILGLLYALTLQPLARAEAAAPALGLHLSPCTQGQAKLAAECGTFGLYENRETRRGRIIELGVVVVKAEHPSHRAISEIAGGPGESATQYAQFLADGYFGKARQALRDDYDYLFVDARGMGSSNPFRCDLMPIGNPASWFRRLWPPQLVKACRGKSTPSHDLSRYNTNNAVDDLDDVRAALGYPRIVLDGGSYGTFFSLVYMRRHPEHVESAILDAVTAPHFQPLLGAPDGAQHALDDLIRRCRDDAACHARFPQFAAHFNAILQRLNSGTLPVPVSNPVTKRIQTVALSKEVFVDQVRHVLYNPRAAVYVPYAIEEAYRRNYAPLGQMIQTVILNISQDLDLGANLSYTCADWLPFITPAQLQQANAHSFAGDLRVQAQKDACAIWNVPPMPPSFNDPVRSNAPVLMLLGSDDPATPPQYGEAALKYLPNGRAVIVKGAGHGADTRCTDQLVLQFVRARSAKGLDVTKCSATLELPAFATSMEGWP